MKTVSSVSLAVGLFAAGASAQVTTTPGNHTGSPGQTIEFAFGFEGDGTVVSSVAFDIPYADTDPYVPVADANGIVDCTVEEDVNADDDLVIFLPAQGIFAVSMGDVSPPAINPIGRDGIIVRCMVRIKDDAALGPFTLGCQNANASSASGQPQTTTCNPGSLNVVPPPTNTATPTITPTPEDTATPTPTPTRAATNTSTPTATTGGGGGGDDDDGCQVVAPADANAAWLLLLPAAVLIWRRRRAR
jgi:hypothetical protein